MLSFNSGRSLEILYDMALISREKDNCSQLHSVGNVQKTISPVSGAACLFIMLTVKAAELLGLETAK